MKETRWSKKKLPRLAPFVRGKTLLNFFTIPSTGFGSLTQCEDVTLTCFKTIDHYTGNFFFTKKGKLKLIFEFRLPEATNYK